MNYMVSFYTVVTVNFNTTLVRDDESAGRLTFILATNRPADQIFTIQVCTEDFIPVLGTSFQMATGWTCIIYKEIRYSVVNIC